MLDSVHVSVLKEGKPDLDCGSVLANMKPDLDCGSVLTNIKPDLASVLVYLCYNRLCSEILCFCYDRNEASLCELVGMWQSSSMHTVSGKYSICYSVHYLHNRVLTFYIHICIFTS